MLGNLGNLNINGVPMSRISAIYTFFYNNTFERTSPSMIYCTTSDLTFRNRQASVNGLCNVHIRIYNFIQNRILIFLL